MLVLQISDEQIIHSHTPLQTLPSLLSKHCVIIGQGQSVSIVQQEYPLTCEFVYALVVCFSFTHESITEYLIVIIITITLIKNQYYVLRLLLVRLSIALLQ